MPSRKGAQKGRKADKRVDVPSKRCHKTIVILNLVQIISLVFSISVASQIAQIFLHPAYGAVLLNHLHEHASFIIVVSCTVIGSFLSWSGKLPNNSILLALISSFFKLMPQFSRLAMSHSGSFGPLYGPRISVLLNFSPILGFSSLSLLCSFFAIGKQFNVNRFYGVLCSTLTFASLWWLHLRISSILTASNILHAFPRCYLTSWISYFIGSLALVNIFFQSRSNEKPVKPKPMKTNRSQSETTLSWRQTLFITISILVPISWGTSAYDVPQCHPGPGITARLHESVTFSGMKLLNRKESVTGMVSVTEHLVNGQWARLLRCDHSVLGGLWTGPAREYVYQNINSSLSAYKPYEIDAKVVSRAESVYATFIMQEAVRLVEKDENDSLREKPHSLVIGLGIGTCAKAFSLHGINVSVAELDPAIYLFAKRYFGLSEPDKVYIEDARGLVQREARDESTDAVRYDFIVHDVFSGGSIAPFLFTVQFWSDIKKVMAPQGVIAVNYVGKEGSLVTRAIQGTLLKSFRYCRSFTDSEPKSDFVKNMVAICSNDITINFRKACEEDFLDSPLRERALSEFENKEIEMYQMQDKNEELLLLLKDETVSDTFSQWQLHAAMAHWHAMRNTLGHESWMFY